MKEAGFLILVSLTAFVIGAPSGNPAIQLQAEFDPHNVKGISGTASLTSNEISLAAARGREGKVALGVGVQETGVIPIGGYGSINLKGMSTLDGMYQALIETELFTGQRSFSPFQLTVMKSPNGLQYSGSSSLGYLSGFYEGSDGSFVINLDTDGFVTANAFGVYSDRKVTWKGYNASVDLGIVSGAINLDDQMKLLNYELGGSLGILHGAMLRNQETKGTSYRAGLNLGIVNFEALFKEDETQAYSTQLDTGMLRFAFNADPNKNDYDWSGTLDMANMMVEYARDKKGGFTIGGRMQIGNSVIGVQRNPNGIFTVKIDKK